MGTSGRAEFARRPVDASKTAMGWHVDFDCLYWAVKFLWERYKKTDLYYWKRYVMP